MADAITTRPLAADDRPDWQRLWRGYLAFYGTERPEEIYDTTFARLLDPDPNEFRCLLAVEKAKVLGLAHFLSHRHCWQANNVIYLQDLFVDEKARGKGIGRALIMAVRDIARQEDAPAVYWVTHESNSAARSLYDRVAENAGFIKYQMNMG